MSDHHDHFEIVEDLHLRLRATHDAGDRFALRKALHDAVFGRCPGCLGDLLLMLLGGLPRLDFVDRSYLFDRLCHLHPANIDEDAVAELFTALSVDNEVEAFSPGIDDPRSFPD
jgi:hypothetical protein